MNLIASPRYLPAVLWADAASAAATGIVHVAGAPLLAGLLGLPQELLATSGYALFAVAAFAAWLARSRLLRRTGVWALVGLNAAWVAGCVELLATGAATAALGQAWLVLLAAAVAGLAVAEWAGLRRAPRTAWA